LSQIQIIVHIRDLDFTLRDGSRCPDASGTLLRRKMSFLCYLCGRQQFVCLGRHSSAMTQPDCYVVKCSLLRPLLYIAYVLTVGDLIELYGTN